MRWRRYLLPGAKFIEVIGNLEVPVERMQSALDLAGCIALMQAQDLVSRSSHV